MGWTKVRPGEYEFRGEPGGPVVATVYLEKPWDVVDRWTWFLTRAGVTRAGRAARWAGTGRSMKACKASVELALEVNP